MVAAQKLINDSEAANYIDPTLVISDEENKRLRRMIHKRYAETLSLPDPQDSPNHVYSLHYPVT